MFEHLPWKAENSIDRFFRNREKTLEIVGSDSVTLLAGLLTLPKIALSERPHLVVVADTATADRLVTSLRFIQPEVRTTLLPGFDVGIYSNLYPNRRSTCARVRWLWEAQNAKPGQIFIATADALVQRTLPYQSLSQRAFKLGHSDALPEDLSPRLEALGYLNVPLVEDTGTFSIRGGIVDVFSPAHDHPVRMELFGDMIESMRFFDAENQRSLSEARELCIIPAQEILFTDENRQRAATQLKASFEGRPLDREEASSLLQQLAQGQYVHGIEFLLASFYDTPALPADHFNSGVNVWRLDPFALERAYDQLVAESKKEYDSSAGQIIRPEISSVFSTLENMQYPEGTQEIILSKVRLGGEDKDEGVGVLPISTSDLKEIAANAKKMAGHANDLAEFLNAKIHEWKNLGYSIFVSVASQAQAQRLRLLLEKSELKSELVESYAWDQWISAQRANRDLIHIVERPLGESLRYTDEQTIFLREDDLFGNKRPRGEYKSSGTLEQRAQAFNFGDLKPGDLIVHKMHGIGVYEGLKVMPIQGIDAEFIQLKYKGNDRLYLPVYRVHQIQKYSGPQAAALVDKLGGTSWEKTKTKVRSHLRDVASELLELYARRASMERPTFGAPDAEFASFEAIFPYTETEDQLRAINDVVRDMGKPTPMDRLVCGDVGFGKTEVAMRAAFHAVRNNKQVAIVAPTTVLTFQHLETFQKRFAKWPEVKIKSLNRFVPKKEISKTIAELKEGQVDIVVGTHRLFSQDVQFKDLGLMIVDEEQRFGVKHKERLRKLRAGLDTLAMSATPIPRTLNMSLVGIRDLSLIHTAPVDRLAIRTFVTKFDADTIRKAIMAEVSRGGQIYFIHNRVQSIYALADQLREIVPEVRMRVAHGQMDEGELEKCMVEFFHHEIDMLICTTIVESGMDVSAANTMFIDNAHQLGLSQLYQLRGRVGRSKERAYCYLMIPGQKRLDKQALERLRILQENTALGSGIRIAQYDLELRGAGDILGEEQAGHVNAVGYEMYLELLEQAVAEVKGDVAAAADIEPDINVRIPALIPDSFIPDLRIRLAYYKQLSEIENPEDIDRIEDELRDQFGKLPDQVLNLMGLMLIRKVCKDLSVRDLSSGEATITLAFTDKTPLSPQKVIELTARGNKKYSITPDSRLRVRMNEITWPRIHDELMYLKSLC